MSSAWTVQKRVIVALILREIHSQFGHTKLGYLWAIVQSGLGIAIFWIFREILNFHAPHGMGTAVFLLCGFIPWYMFNNTITRCLHAVDANRALLTFPQVTELDLMIGRLIVVWGTQLICAFIIFFIAGFIGEENELRHPSTLISTICMAPILGFSFGLIFASLARMWSTIERIIPIALRILFFASGIFFQISELPSRFSEPLLYNPVAQIIEWQRYGFSASSVAPIFSINYVIIWCGVTLCLGLLLERHVRGRNIQ